MISQEELNNKVRKFIEKEPETVSSPADFHFEDAAIRFNMETKDNKVFEATFCEAYQRKQFLLALSAQIGCPVRCKFCQLGKNGLTRNLSPDEILDQIRLMLRKAQERNYPIFSKPLKLSFVMGGDALTNKDFAEAFRRIRDEIPLKIKISTVFPKTEVADEVYKEIVEIAKDYPNIVQFQVSLNSTNEEYRQNLTSIPLADFKRLREAGELWFEKVSNPRKINLTFTMSQDTLLDPEDIYKKLPSELFAIRFRPWVPTKVGEENGMKIILDEKFERTKKKFEDAGYMYIPGKAGHIERHFRLAPGQLLELYPLIRRMKPAEVEQKHIRGKTEAGIPAK